MRYRLGIATTLTLFACGNALAAGMTADEYKASSARIAAAYEAARQKCGAGIGDGVDLCVAHARGAQKVSKAELEAAYKPTPGNNYAAAIARAEAAYSITREECNDKDAQSRKICEKEAKAVLERAKAEAKTAMKAAT